MTTETEWLVRILLALFALVVMIVFRHRWQGALGWVLIGTTFIWSVTGIGRASILSSSIAAVLIVLGIGLAGYDYLYFERPKRQQRRQIQRDEYGLPPIRRRRRRRVLTRRRPDHKEHP